MKKELNNKPRFLLIQLMHHGDVLLTTAVADALKAALPDCSVDMLVYKGMEDVLMDNPLISRVHTIDRSWKKQGLLVQIRKEFALAGWVQVQGYDAVLNFSNRWRAGVLAKISRAPKAVSFNWPNRRNILWKKFHTDLPEPCGNDVHVVDNNLSMLKALDLPDCGHKPQVSMAVSEGTRESLKKKLAEAGWRGESYVLVHPGSRWFFKCWQDEKMAVLLQKILSEGHNVVLTAAPDEREHRMLENLLSQIHIALPQKLWVLDGVLTLRELAAAIDGAKLFIGVDSVPMHMAAALDKPQVALFGPSWVNRWKPYSDKAEVVWAGDFGELPYPDSIDVNTADRYLNAIPVEAVWEAVKRKLHGQVKV